MKIGLSRAKADIDCFFWMGVEADESDEVDDGDDENSVEIESLDPLSELVSAGPKQLSTTGRYASPWNRPKATTPKNS